MEVSGQPKLRVLISGIIESSWVLPFDVHIKTDSGARCQNDPD